MIFYHVRFNIEDESRKFTPRIPTSKIEYEDGETSRVCVSDALLGALSGCPFGSTRLELAKKLQHGYFKFFKIDTDKLGIKKFVTPKELQEECFVPDALNTGECWILEEFEVPEEDVFVARAISWETEMRAISSGDLMPVFTDFQMEFLETQQALEKESCRLIAQSGEYLLNPERFELAYSNPLQVRILEEALESSWGKDFLNLMNPGFDYQQTRELADAFKKGHDPSSYAKPGINWMVMRRLLFAQEQGHVVLHWLNTDEEVSYLTINEHIKKAESERTLKNLNSF